MKVTKQGYVIRLSDTEMDVLNSLVGEGIGGIVELTDRDGWSPQMKAAYTRRANSGPAFLRIDEARRAKR